MKKKYVKRTIGILSLVLCLTIGFFLAQTFWLRQIDNNDMRLRGLYLEDPDSLEMIVLGSSEVYNDYAAPEAYRLYGFTSYPFAFETNPVTLWKYELTEILKTQHPKVLLVEVNGCVYDDELLHKYAAIRYLADSMKLSRNKIDLVNDLGTDSAMSYYVPLIKYHGKWKSKPNLDLLNIYKDGHCRLRGTFSHTVIKPTGEERDLSGETGTLPLDPLAEERLNEFMDLAEASGIEHVVFCRFPHQVIDDRSYNQYLRNNRVAEIVQARGFDYIDFSAVQGELGLDKTADWYDGEHLNARGQQKFSAYLGKVLSERYGLGNRDLTEKQRAEWEDSADLIGYYFRYFDQYMAANPDNQDTGDNLRDGLRTLRAIAAIKAAEQG
ncbi:MAG: hypothetical protein IJM69_00670 [Firmicutes bacterium]|nr:hypothetical protein [Bacillota bacterium]